MIKIFTTLAIISLSLKTTLSQKIPTIAAKRDGNILTFINQYKCTGNVVNAFSSVVELIEYMITDYQNPNGYLRNKPYKVVMDV